MDLPLLCGRKGKLTGMDQTGKQTIFPCGAMQQMCSRCFTFFLNATEIDATFTKKNKASNVSETKIFNSNPCQTNKQRLTIPPKKIKSPQKSNRVLKESPQPNPHPTRKFRRSENSIRRAFLASASMSVSQVKNLVLPLAGGAVGVASQLVSR